MSVFYCNKCSKEYNYTDKRPLSLPCGDVFCEKCILQIYDHKNNTLICPSDQKKFTIEFRKIPICVQILSNLPNNCNNSPLDPNIYCVRHPNKKINYYCDNDKMFLCLNCINQHVGHNYREFNYTKENFFQEVSILKNNFTEIKSKYLSSKKNREKFLIYAIRHFDEQIHKINNYFDTLISSLHEYKSKYISKIMNVSKEYKKKLEKFKTFLAISDEKYSRIINKINIIYNDLFPKGDYETFYNLKNQLLIEIKNFKISNDNNICDNNFNSCKLLTYICPKNTFNNEENLYGSFEDLLIDINVNNNKNNKNDKNNKNNNNGGHKRCISNISNKKVNNKLLNSHTRNNTIINRNSEKVIHNVNNNISNNIINNNIIENDLKDLMTINTPHSNICNNFLDSSFLEKNNILNNGNSNNNNDSFIDKQLIETGSTFFLLNKNDVRNVFKQQESESSQNESINYEYNNTKNHFNECKKKPENNTNINTNNNINTTNNNTKNILKNNNKPYKLINNNSMNNNYNYFKKNRERTSNQKNNNLRESNSTTIFNNINNSYKDKKNYKKKPIIEKDQPIYLIARLNNSENIIDKSMSSKLYQKNKIQNQKVGTKISKPRGNSYKKMDKNRNSNLYHYKDENTSIIPKKIKYSDEKKSCNIINNYNNSLVNNNLITSYNRDINEKNKITKNRKILTEECENNKNMYKINNSNSYEIKDLIKQKYINEHFFSPIKGNGKKIIYKCKDGSNFLFHRNKKINQNKNEMDSKINIANSEFNNYKNIVFINELKRNNIDNNRMNNQKKHKKKKHSMNNDSIEMMF